MTNEIEITNIKEAENLAIQSAKSGLFASRDASQMLMILLTGKELGFTPMASVRSIYIVQGKPVLSADAMVAIVRRSGKCKLWTVVESTATRCEIHTMRDGDTELQKCVWTDVDGKRISGTKDTWRQYPAQMLRHRCAADLARMVYPDVLFGLYAEEEMRPEPAHARVATAAPAETIDAEIDDALPLPLQRLVDDISSLGDTLTVAQIRTLFTEHVTPMTGDLRVRGRAVLCESMPNGVTIASPDHTTLLCHPDHTSPTLEQHIASIELTDSVRSLEILRDSLPKATQGALKQHIFIRRVALSPDLADLSTLRPAAAKLREAVMRSAVLAAIEIRANELAGPPPTDGGPDGDDREHDDDDVEREAIQGEDATPLTAAVAKLHATHGPRHAVSHYLLHRDELPAAMQPAYRRALIDHLPYRYPNDVRTRERAESIVSDAEQGSVRRAA